MLLDEIKKLLKTVEKYFSKEEELLKNIVLEDTIKMDKGLIKLLMSNEKSKNHFFIEIEGVLIFDKDKFIKFIENKEFLPNSYTTYKNKIGLTDNRGEFIKEKNDVVLSWAYKDCYLEGGQDKEDMKRDEIFYNEILAPDEIDRLLEPKVLTNFKKYDVNGEHKVEDITMEDNLIIKGNNLLALHSLKEKYAGQIKLIYIDPPYNTGNDSFKYNDRFNHSTWLTFMKNRLEVAKKLLRDDGVIFVHCDNNEQAYIKILLDEIFGIENFIETITVVNNPRGRDYGGVANMHEFIQVYSKTGFYEMYKIIDHEKEFNYSDKIGSFDIRELRNRNTAFNDKNRPNLCYPFYVSVNEKDENGFHYISLEKMEGYIEIFPTKSQGIQTVWRWGKDKAKENLNVNIMGKKMQEDGRYMIIEKYRDNSRLARSVWWDKEVNSERGTVHLRELFGEKVFAFPKPETLMSRIIEISTIENDIILDYHLGSGTTATTAHKMGRRYIGIEQMDYIEDISVERLKKVIGNSEQKTDTLFSSEIITNFDEGGISKEVNWQGGGSFIYCELMKWNEIFIEKINNAKNIDELLDIYSQIKGKAFLNYKFDIDKFEEENMKDFKELKLEEQKKIIKKSLDLNSLYVNLSEIEDETYSISDEDKNLNKIFYKK